MNNRVWSLLSLLLATSSASADMFPLRGTTQNAAGGFIHPALLVGFNPQPDPPGENTFLDLRDPFRAMFNTRSASPSDRGFEIIFGLGLANTTSEFMGHNEAAPNDDGVLEFDCLFGDGSVFNIRMRVMSDGMVNGGSWVGFNPQPEPPEFPGAIGFMFNVGSPSRGDGLGNSASLEIEVFNGQNRVAWEIPPAPTAALSLMAAMPMLRRRRQ